MKVITKSCYLRDDSMSKNVKHWNTFWRSKWIRLLLDLEETLENISWQFFEIVFFLHITDFCIAYKRRRRNFPSRKRSSPSRTVAIIPGLIEYRVTGGLRCHARQTTRGSSCVLILWLSVISVWLFNCDIVWLVNRFGNRLLIVYIWKERPKISKTIFDGETCMNCMLI